MDLFIGGAENAGVENVARWYDARNRPCMSS